MSAQRRIVILAAIDQELLPIARRLRLEQIRGAYYRRRGELEIVAATTGMGGDRAAQYFSRLARDVRPQLVVHCGFAGALDERLKVGKVIAFSRVLSESGGGFALTVDDLATPRPAEGASEGPTLLSLRQPALSAKRKADLRQRYGATAVDCESVAVAAHAASLAIPYVCVRAISDPSDGAILPSALDWVDETGASLKWRALRHLLCRPWHAPAVMRLRRDSRLAATNLAEHLQQLLQRLGSQAGAAAQRSIDQPFPGG